MRTAQRDSVCSHTCWQNGHIRLLNWFALISPSGRSFTHSTSVKENVYGHCKWHQYVVPAIFYRCTFDHWTKWVQTLSWCHDGRMRFGQGRVFQGQREVKVPFGALKSFSIVPCVLINWSFQSRAFSVFVTSVTLRPSTTLLGFIWRCSTRQGSTLNCVLLVFYRDRSGLCALSRVAPASASTRFAHNISTWALADATTICFRLPARKQHGTFVNAKKLLEGERLPSSFSSFRFCHLELSEKYICLALWFFFSFSRIIHSH